MVCVCINLVRTPPASVVSKMVLDARLQYRRTGRYNTASNKVRIVRTPGNKLVFQHQKKLGGYVRCRVSGQRLHGIKRARPVERSRQTKYSKTVSRPYGGNLSASVVKDRIMRAFLISENECVQNLLRTRK